MLQSVGHKIRTTSPIQSTRANVAHCGWFVSCELPGQDAPVGPLEGELVGCIVGANVGESDAVVVGTPDGTPVGEITGDGDGDAVYEIAEHCVVPGKQKAVPETNVVHCPFRPPDVCWHVH